MELVAQKKLSPAKINLMLRILGQRSDGYHQLQTCFQLLDWGDQMLFEPIKEKGGNEIKISGFANLAYEDNLIYQAVQMIKPWAENTSDWHIKVEKVIPQGAGLGGGSSNAATTLKFLNEVWRCDLSTFDLLAMSVKLGADVPVFVLGQGAVATGVGEVLLPTQFDTPYIVLLLPNCHVNTAALFNESDLTRDQVSISPAQLHEQSFWINDCFPEVLRQFPQIFDIYEHLKAKINLRLSGTGSAMFALYDNQEDAQKAQQLAAQVCQAVLVEPNNARN